MTLDPLTSHPSKRSYVLKLHRDAKPSRAHMAGRLENMTTGRHFDFNTADELLACLTADLTLTLSAPQEDL